MANEDEFDVEGFDAVEVVNNVTEQPAEGSADGQVDAAAQAATQAEAEKKAAEEKAKAEKKAADEAALKKFQETADAAVKSDQADPDTGTLPEAVKSDVTGAYSKLSSLAVKKAAKEYLRVAMQKAMMEGPSGYLRARSYLELFQAVEATKAGREPMVRTPVDPTEQHVQRVAAMYLAANLAVPGEGVADDWQAKVQQLAASVEGDVKSLRAWLVEHGSKADDDTSKAEQPEVNPVVLAALRIAQGRGTGPARKSKATGESNTREPYTGEKGDIAQHIGEAFANVASGTYLSVADMVNFVSSQYGGDRKKPSPGAIAARLFPRNGGACTIDGITPASTPHKGAVKN